MKRIHLVSIGAVLALALAVGGFEFHKAKQSKICAPTRESCKAHLEAGCTTSGVHTITLKSGAALPVYCDMSVDGGGWMLVLNYSHRAATNPPLLARQKDLPLSSDAPLGTDESGTPNWGHASNSLLSTFDFSELRFHCRIQSAKNKVLDFKTSLPGCMEYFKTGKGSCAGIQKAFTPLSGHSTRLPGSANKAFESKGDLAMTDFPFYEDRLKHWGIHGLGNRWECDEYNNGPGYSTLHQIYVR